MVSFAFSHELLKVSPITKQLLGIRIDIDIALLCVVLVAFFMQVHV